MQKKCSKCKEVKDVSFFKKDPKMKLGYNSWCRECNNIAARIRYQEKNGAAKSREYWHKTTKHKKPWLLLRDYKKEWARIERHNPNYKIKQIAHNYVVHGVAEGKIIRPTICPICDGKKKIEAHHHFGYDYPKDFIWLCRDCHAFLHRILREVA